MGQTVLVVEDDADIVELLELLRVRDADVALVDIMMPRMNGYDFIKALRRVSSMPVIVVSARTQPADKIVALDAGADGYIAKPFDPLEVTAYFRAVPRCAEASAAASASAAAEKDALPRPSSVPSPAAITVGALTFDTERLTLSKDGAPVALTAAELKIMAALMASPRRVFSKDQLYACVNGELVPGGEGSVMMRISNIRAKLEDDPLSPRFIKTVRGLGYLLNEA